MEPTMKTERVAGAGGVGEGALWRLILLPALALGLMLMLPPETSRAQGPAVPDVLPYAGAWVNGDGDVLGTPSPKNYDVIFRIYDDASAGRLIWAEQQTVTVDAGRYSVQLGLGGPNGTEPKPSLSSVFRSKTASDRFLETTVKGIGPGRADSTLMPRVRMLPSAYAMVSQYARTAERLVDPSSATVLSVLGSKVGINTTNPLTTLHVEGNARGSSLRVNGEFRSGGVATASSWVGAGAVPVGTVILWSGSASERPTGWALCDGTVVSGYRTPDLRGRFILGAGAGPGLTERKVGERGGAEAVALAAAEVPSHGHFMNPSRQVSAFDGQHSHSIQTEAHSTGILEFEGWGSDFMLPGMGSSWHWGSANPVNRTRGTVQTSSTPGHDHWLDLNPTESSESGGGGQPHPNMPPFYVLAYIVRVQ